MVQEDFGGFGDARLRRIGARLLEAMGGQPTTCVHAQAKDRNQALSFGRFLDHSSVSHGEMLTTAGRSTGQRAAGRHVLAIQDTTEFNSPVTPPANAASDVPAMTATLACSCTRRSLSTRR